MLHPYMRKNARHHTAFSLLLLWVSLAVLRIQTVQDLKGRRFAFAGRGSVQAGLLAYYFLKQTGIDPEKDLALATFTEDRPTSGPAWEPGVVALVRAREYDAGAVSTHALATATDVEAALKGAAAQTIGTNSKDGAPIKREYVGGF